MKACLSRLFGARRCSPPPAAPLDLEQLSASVRRLQEQHEADCEARRRLLVGTVLLAHAQTHPELDAYLGALLDHFLEDDRDRALFDLAPRDPYIPGTPPPPCRSGRRRR